MSKKYYICRHAIINAKVDSYSEHKIFISSKINTYLLLITKYMKMEQHFSETHK